MAGKTQSQREAKITPLGVLMLVSLGGIVALSFVAALSQRDADEPERVADEADVVFLPEPVTFAPGLHLLGALTPSVAYVIETTDGLILVDTGLEDGHTLLLQQLESLRLDVLDLKAILITHGHGDHYLGAKELQQMTGAKLYVGQGDSGVLRDAGPRDAVFSTFPMGHVAIHPTDVDVELVGGEAIEIGDVKIQVIATPGHTPGSICYLLERNDQTALFSGDTIMTITGDLGTYATYLPPRYRGNSTEYLATLQKLAALPAPDLLLPGHPRTNWRTVSARVSPADWARSLNQGIQEMEQLNARYATDGDDFLDGRPRELLPELYYLGEHAGVAVYCFAKDSAIVLMDAPGGTGLLGFLDERLGNVGLDLSMLAAVVLTDSDSESTAGLVPLVEKYSLPIVVAESDQGEIRERCPDATLLSSTEANEWLSWLQLEPLPIRGFGRTRTAYTTTWKGKSILLSGRTPLKISVEIIQELEEMQFDPHRFLPSLRRLQLAQPDLWLPSKPLHGQNANLYGADWEEIIRENRLSLGL